MPRIQTELLSAYIYLLVRVIRTANAAHIWLMDHASRQYIRTCQRCHVLRDEIEQRDPCGSLGDEINGVLAIVGLIAMFALVIADTATALGASPSMLLAWGMDRIIGLAGRAGTGKNTVGDILWKHGYTQVAFADPLREMLCIGLDLNEDLFHNRALKEQEIEWLGKSPRQLMQSLGTEWGRDMVHPELWVKIANYRIEQTRALLHPQPIHLVFTDVRFEDEAAMIRRQDGTIWHITRPDANPVSDHISERGIEFNPADQLIANNKDIAALTERVAELLN